MSEKLPKPYPYQEAVKRRVLEGKNLVVQAPTGAGKTVAALQPFFEAWERGELTARNITSQQVSTVDRGGSPTTKNYQFPYSQQAESEKTGIRTESLDIRSEILYHQCRYPDILL